MAKKTSFFATIASYNLVISNLLGPNNSKSKGEKMAQQKNPNTIHSIQKGSITHKEVPIICTEY